MIRGVVFLEKVFNQTDFLVFEIKKFLSLKYFLKAFKKSLARS